GHRSFRLIVEVQPTPRRFLGAIHKIHVADSPRFHGTGKPMQHGRKRETWYVQQGCARPYRVKLIAEGDGVEPQLEHGLLEEGHGEGDERERGIKSGDSVAVVEEEARGIARATAGIEDVGWWREDAGEVAIPRHRVRVVRVRDERRRMALVVL